MHFIDISERAFVIAERVVAVGHGDSAATRRLMAVTSDTNLIDLTGGERRRSFLVMDSGHIILTSLPVRLVRERLILSGV